MSEVKTQEALLRHLQGLIKRCEAGEVNALVIYESIRAPEAEKIPLSVMDSSSDRLKMAKALATMVPLLMADIEDEGVEFGAATLTYFTEEEEEEEEAL